jgi:hypothetical protein
VLYASCAEENSRLGAKAALIVISERKVVAEPGQNVINLHQSNAKMLADWNIDSSTDHEVKSVVARRITRHYATKHATFGSQLAIEIRMRSTAQCLDKRLKVASGAELQDWPGIISKEISF